MKGLVPSEYDVRPFNEYFVHSDKSPMQRVFFKNNEGDLLPVSGWAVNFFNFVIIYIFKCKSQWYIEEWHFTELEMVKY